MEIDVILKMEFPGYFLIVWDFIRWAKENGIPVGPGRGSGAGSIVAYALRITDLDPIPYNLLFERFLNPERVTMPDFDVDFCHGQPRRGHRLRHAEVRREQRRTDRHVRTSSRRKSVDQGRRPRAWASRVEAQTDRQLIPSRRTGKTYTIPRGARDRAEAAGALRDERTRRSELLEQAQELEGLTRHAGMHAAGVVISGSRSGNHVPVLQAVRQSEICHRSTTRTTSSRRGSSSSTSSA